MQARVGEQNAVVWKFVYLSPRPPAGRWWGGDGAAVAPELGEAAVVEHHHQDVGPPGRNGLGGRDADDSASVKPICMSGSLIAADEPPGTFLTWPDTEKVIAMPDNAVSGDYAGPFDPEWTLDRLSRAALARLCRE